MNKKTKNILKYSFLIILLFCLIGCKAKKETIYISQTDSLQKEITYLKQTISHLQKEIYIVQDSLIIVKGLNEKSTYEGKDSVSFLETSYAESFASVINGILKHTLQNKDSIPSQQKIEKQLIYIHETDTIFIRDSIYIDTSKTTDTQQTIVEKESFLDKFKSIFYIIAVIFIIFVIFNIIQKFKK